MDQTDIAVLRGELSAARHLLAAKDEEIARLRAADKVRAAEVASVREARAASDQRLTQLAEQVDKLAASQQLLLKERQVLDEAKDAVERELWTFRDTADNAAHELAAASGERDALQQNIAQAEQLIGELRQDVAERASVIKRLETEARSAAEARYALEAELRQTQEAIAGSHAKAAALEKEIKAKKKDLAARVAKQDELSGQLKSVRKELTQAKSQIVAQEAEAKRALELAKIKDDEVARRTADVATASKMLNEVKEENGRLKKRRATLSGDVARQNTELSLLQLEILRLEKRSNDTDGEFSRLIHLLIERAAPTFLPKSMRLNQQRKVLEKFSLFDNEWYLENNHDVLESGIDGQSHFLEFGLDEGRAPKAEIGGLRPRAAN